MYTMFGYGRCVVWECATCGSKRSQQHCHFAAWPARPIKPSKFENKAARATQSESDPEPDSALGSARTIGILFLKSLFHARHTALSMSSKNPEPPLFFKYFRQFKDKKWLK